MANTTPTFDEEDQNLFKPKISPKDSVSHSVLILLGFCTGLPWSVITNSGSLFEEKLRGTSYGDAFLSHFASIFLAVKFLFLLISVRLQFFLSTHNQIVISIPVLSFLLLLFAVICSLSYSNQFLFYALNLFLSLFVSFFSALFKAGTFGLVGHLPSYYLKALFIGEGISSVFMAAYSLALSFVFCPRQSCSLLGFVNFGMASIIMIFSLFIYLVVRKRPIFLKTLDLPNEEESEIYSEQAFTGICSLMGQVHPEIIATCVSGLISLFIFPYLITHTESNFNNNSFYGKRLFRPLAFLIFYSGDLFGKSFPALITFNRNRIHLMKIVLGRLGFVPLFLLGNFKVKGHHLLPNVIGFDLIFFCLILLTSFSGGFSSTMASLMAPKRVGPVDRGRVTTILSAFSILGNLFGSIASSIFAFILNKSQ